MKKIYSFLEKDEFYLVLERIRPTKKIVTTNGCFDILHHGHLTTLYKASIIGDLLIVGLNSDESVRLSKGDKRPILNQQERSMCLASLSYVNYVYIYNDKTSEEFIKLVRPDIHVNCAIYGENCVERNALDECGTELHMVPFVSDISTSIIIERILERYT